MKTKINKYDVFSKVFAQLSGESQDKLVETAHRLLKTHQFIKPETIKSTKIRQEAKGV
jgi:hypothetical protein